MTGQFMSGDGVNPNAGPRGEKGNTAPMSMMTAVVTINGQLAQL
jgi:hypothetical protein